MTPQRSVSHRLVGSKVPNFYLQWQMAPNYNTFDKKKATVETNVIFIKNVAAIGKNLRQDLRKKSTLTL